MYLLKVFANGKENVSPIRISCNKTDFTNAIVQALQVESVFAVKGPHIKHDRNL